MQKAIPYRAYSSLAAGKSSSSSSSSTLARDSRDGTSDGGAQTNNHDVNGDDYVAKMVTENAVIVFGKRGCCMCHVVKRLLQGLGVNPAVFEVDEDKENEIIRELSQINGDNHRAGEVGNGGVVQFPAVFVGGKLFGGLDRVMATHITGELVPILKDAGALWL